MSTYSYEATTREGTIVTGSIEAADERLAVDRLQEMHYFPLKISKAEEHKSFTSSLLSFMHARISEPDIMTFTYQLGVLLEAGFPLERALSILSGLTEKKALGELIKEILSHIRSGKSFSESLSKFPTVFPMFYVNMIKAGEAGGFLEDTISRMSDYLENSQAIKNDIRSALIYPLLLIVVGGTAVIFLLTYVVPKFTVIFSDLGEALPLPTIILLGISNGLKNYWWIFLLILFTGSFALRQYLKSGGGGRSWDTLRFKMPVLGKLYREVAVFRFTKTLGTLLGSGVPILNALQIVKGTLESEKITGIISSIRDGVRKGKSISEHLKNNDIFPPIAVHMIAVGEETGKLDEMLLKVAERFDIEVKNTIKRLLSLLQPVLILLMGVIVGFIVIAILMAMFSVYDIPI